MRTVLFTLMLFGISVIAYCQCPNGQCGTQQRFLFRPFQQQYYTVPQAVTQHPPAPVQQPAPVPPAKPVVPVKPPVSLQRVQTAIQLPPIPDTIVDYIPPIPDSIAEYVPPIP